MIQYLAFVLYKPLLEVPLFLIFPLHLLSIIKFPLYFELRFQCYAHVNRLYPIPLHFAHLKIVPALNVLTNLMLARPKTIEKTSLYYGCETQHFCLSVWTRHFQKCIHFANSWNIVWNKCLKFTVQFNAHWLKPFNYFIFTINNLVMYLNNSLISSVTFKSAYSAGS